MKGLKDAVKGIKFLDRDEVIAQGVRAYRMGIARENNPRKPEGERRLWEIGWTKARDQWTALLQRNEGSLR